MPFFYSTDLKSQTLDPSSDITNTKTTFRFAEDTAYYPNLRLANVGSHGSVAHTYNRVAGVYGCIKHIRLVSNGVELDSMRFANRYLAWRNLTNTNRANASVNRKLVKHNLGFEEQKIKLQLPLIARQTWDIFNSRSVCLFLKICLLLILL